ncbi:MAG: hypothetical protein K6T71_06460 [Candidatus Bipolaricaulota bacterium]|nr:hypothetical protein [Candidatus Bipolaricaulota bacterium]
MNGPGDWSWFRELLTPLQRLGERPCPSRAILSMYVRGQLRDLWRVGAHLLNPDDWTLTEVSQHLLTCPACARQLALMRRRELEHTSVWRELWESLPGALRAHFAAYALALLALVIVNALLVTLVPAPTVALPCVPVGPAHPFGSEMPDRDLKLDGLNKPAKLPQSLSNECAPVPAPRPPWQTWWSVWILLLWTPLLGLHLVWEWLGGTIPAQRRPAATSLASFVSFFL